MAAFPWDDADHKAQDETRESWGQGIDSRRELSVEQSSRRDQANPEPDHL